MNTIEAESVRIAPGFMRAKARRIAFVVKRISYNCVVTSSECDKMVSEAVERIADAGRVSCLTGAGISAESGIPTFRGAGGLWRGRRAEDVATPEAFARDPADVWEFYLERRTRLADKQPNAGHLALAKLEQLTPRFTLVTQNVDGLHHHAGSQNVIELHGNIWVDRCTRCAFKVRRSSDVDVTGADVARDVADDDIPFCAKCRSMMRPGVVWFGEALPVDAIMAAQEAASECDVMLVVGTSAVVQPAASLADWAREGGAFVIEVNPDETSLSSSVDLRFPCAAGDVLPSIADGVAATRPET
jgi:NAD-dependent protein deacetylase/lipoamidase